MVEGSEGQPVVLYDLQGRVLATRRDTYLPIRFDVPASGVYMVKIADYAAKKVTVIR
ncbi:MAG: T9SS type A sorting domain-containing protein [Bacteroidales bacterium]|nr:T9SS type A sorting domain-containing protein [Bacteroidales bacterium]